MINQIETEADLSLNKKVGFDYQMFFNDCNYVNTKLQCYRFQKTALDFISVTLVFPQMAILCGFVFLFACIHEVLKTVYDSEKCFEAAVHTFAKRWCELHRGFLPNSLCCIASPKCGLLRRLRATFGSGPLLFLLDFVCLC